jgi:cation diffusion facilitator CzcD-associated flavoprotein CzcO
LKHTASTTKMAIVGLGLAGIAAAIAVLVAVRRLGLPERRGLEIL